MSNVVVVPKNPNPEVVRKLEEALEWAKSGSLISFALAGVCSDGFTVNIFDANNSVMALLGEMRTLERDVVGCAVDLRCHQRSREY